MHSLSYELCFPSRVCPVLIVLSKLQYALAGNICYPFRVTSSINLIKWTKGMLDYGRPKTAVQS